MLWVHWTVTQTLHRSESQQRIKSCSLKKNKNAGLLIEKRKFSFIYLGHYNKAIVLSAIVLFALWVGYVIRQRDILFVQSSLVAIDLRTSQIISFFKYKRKECMFYWYWICQVIRICITMLFAEVRRTAGDRSVCGVVLSPQTIGWDPVHFEC